MNAIVLYIHHLHVIEKIIIVDMVKGSKMTNFERIKNMTVEEMADFFDRYIHCDNCPAHCACLHSSCFKSFCNWLEDDE